MCGGRGASVKREGTVRVGEIKGCNLLFFEARSKRIRIVDCQTVATKWSRKTVEFFWSFRFVPFFWLFPRESTSAGRDISLPVSTQRKTRNGTREEEAAAAATRGR
jgi:hypothetical protein